MIRSMSEEKNQETLSRNNGKEFNIEVISEESIRDENG
jgi:hypothetical protein